MTVAFSEALNGATVNANTILLRNSSNSLVVATVTYNASSASATLTPISPLANSMTYTVTVVGGASGVKDVAGDAIATSFFSSFLTIAPQNPTSSLWSTSVTPGVTDSGDAQGAELGVKFTTTTNGFITGIASTGARSTAETMSATCGRAPASCWPRRPSAVKASSAGSR